MTASTEFNNLADDIFAALGETATYLPERGEAVSVKVLFRRRLDLFPDAADLQLSENDFQVKILRSDIATPRVGDHLVYDSETYRVALIDPGADDYVHVLRVNK